MNILPINRPIPAKKGIGYRLTKVIILNNSESALFVITLDNP
ncbi:hypothetical protein [Candidatus Nitrosarchaeum limnium]|nr:hypothetical protein [Candidatus Nitrosarchaeum limnium]